MPLDGALPPGPQVTTAKARAYLNIDMLNLVGTTWTKVLLDTATYDPSSIFAANKFTIKVPGYYAVIGMVTFVGASVIADYRYLGAIYKNGVAVVQDQRHAAIVAEMSLHPSDIIHCDVDDFLELWVIAVVVPNTVDVWGATLATYMSAHLLSAD